MTSGTQNDSTSAVTEMSTLSRILHMQIDSYVQLESLLEAKREAIRVADGQVLDEITHAEHQVLSRIRELERQRRLLVVRISRAHGQDSPVESVRDLVDVLDDETGSSLRDLATELRGHVERVSRLAAMLREATESLSRHLTGLVQTFQGAVNQSRRYGCSGGLAVDTAAETFIDVKS